MKNTMSILILFLIFPWGLSAGEVTFIIKNFQSNEGKVEFGVYADPDEFLEETITVACQAEPIQEQQAKVVCELKSGTYAIAFYHDENDNGELDSNWLKIPQESIGFTRDAKGTFGPPDFEDAAIDVGEEKLEFVITLYEIF